MVFLSGLHFAFTGFVVNIMLYLQSGMSSTSTTSSSSASSLSPSAALNAVINTLSRPARWPTAFTNMVSVILTNMQPTVPLVVLAIGDVGSVAFFNLTLANNSVGFYQICKIMCIPVTVALQYMFQNKKTTMPINVSLVVMLLGVYVATVTEVSVRAIGIIYGSLAVLCTSFAHIFIGHLQDKLQLGPAQLLSKSAPLVSLGMALLSPFFDNLFNNNPAIGEYSLMHYPFTAGVYQLIALTCLFAVGVNLSNFIIIGKTSPVTYQVVGHFKTCLVLVAGFYLFSSRLAAMNVVGVLVAWSGMILYTEIRRREGLAAAAVASAATTSTSSSSSSSAAAADDFDDLDDGHPHSLLAPSSSLSSDTSGAISLDTMAKLRGAVVGAAASSTSPSSSLAPGAIATPLDPESDMESVSDATLLLNRGSNK